MANVRFLRQAHGLTYRELAVQLAKAGRPIPELGLSRLERGERRIDVDDLVALAQVLGVTPQELLFTDAVVTMAAEETCRERIPRLWPRPPAQAQR